jgi:hypothetical protein
MLAPKREPLTEEDKATVRYAMLSVYYHSLGREFEIRGAPAMMLPQQAVPLSLDEALETLQRWPDRVRDAVWRIVRAYPPPRAPDELGALRYPSALGDAIARLNAEADPKTGQLDLAKFDIDRRRCRFGAHLFAAALVACAQEQWADFRRLKELIARQSQESDEPSMFDAAASEALGMSTQELLDTLPEDRDARREARNEIAKLEDEVGLNIYDFVEEFADAVAFEQFWPTPEGRPLVYPASSVIRQDTSTLTTTATVTTLVRGPFEMLVRAVDPRYWPLASDVMKSTCYVEDALTLTRVAPDVESPPPALLEETCELSWGSDGGISTFNQVLVIEQFSIKEDEGSIELRFSLARSIRSRVLWDERGGGILIDEGYIKVRRISDGHWRVTSRKVLNFSDRTPNAATIDGVDIGQMLNYLAPAAMIWWVESEMYSTACDVYADDAEFETALAGAKKAMKEHDDG